MGRKLVFKSCRPAAVCRQTTVGHCVAAASWMFIERQAFQHSVMIVATNSFAFGFSVLP